MRLCCRHNAALIKPATPAAPFEVPDVRLDRTNQEWSVRGPALRVHPAQGQRFDRIAKRRPGAVGFDIVDSIRLDLGPVERLANHIFLRRTVRRRQPVAPSVVVDGAAKD